ncbi:PaaI family thioesterase [Microbulbifer sp. 2304DJ12-6]|uniref:PaaI family thioesterase n=1 Tax=Microbulbifer sp. 2304DJ12-6 TaxID=3233340 RepID=UPI0039AF71AC
MVDIGTSGMKRMAQFSKTQPRPGMAGNLDYQIKSVIEGRVVYHYTPKQRHQNLIGSLHGGILAALLDSAMGAAVMTRLGPGENHSMVDLTVKFIGAVRDEEPLIIEAQVDHCGKRLFATSGSIRTAKGRLIARALANAVRL